MKSKPRIEREQQFHDQRYSDGNQRRQHIRSEDEHPLLKKDLRMIENKFKKSKISYFYLTSLAASLIAGKPGFKMMLNCCRAIDSILLKIPGIKQQAWMVLVELEQPIKSA